MLVVLRRRLDVSHFLALRHHLTARTLELVQKRHRFNQREKALVVSACPQVTIREGQVLGVRDHHAHRLQQPLGVVVFSAQGITADDPAQTIMRSSAPLMLVNSSRLLGALV